MLFSRRSFTAAALGVAVGSRFSVPAFAESDARLAAALAAIRAFGEADLAFNQLPGMTLGAVTPHGGRTVLNFGYADVEARTAITPETLFQIGSISKVMVAAVLHQLADEGRLRLTDRVSDLLPNLPLPPNNQVQVQHLLDHVAGIPADAPLFPERGLWTGYAPGAHWHYSNTGYEILGKVAEHAGGKPLAQLLRERIFAPLGMSHSRGAIVGTDRRLYAQGYEAADQLAPYVRGVPLAPAPWVDVTFGAGCVASTANDMLSLLQTLSAAVSGKGGLGLSPLQATQFTNHIVPSDTPGMSYGNGLMHIGNGGRSYFHHTGGMLFSSSSFHLDLASGVGAFASANINAFAGYRPRLLTQFAVDALTNTLGGQPIPAPPPLAAPLRDAGSYVGRYAGPAGAFEVRPGSPLTIVGGGQSAPLIQWTDAVFRTTHPHFHNYSILFERAGAVIVAAGWGPNAYAREGRGAPLSPSDPALARLAGRYIDDNPWYGPAPVVERGGKLWIGTETPMVPIGDNLWRVGAESWSPERASFADLIDGRPQTFIFSGVRYARHEV